MAGRTQEQEQVRQVQEQLQQGQVVAATAACEQLLTLNPDQPFALSFLAGQAMQAGDHQRSVELSTRVAESHPGQVTLQQNLGVALEAAGKPQQALRAYVLALELRPRSALLHLYLARALGKTDQTHQAACCAARAFALDPGLASAFKRQDVPVPVRDLSHAVYQDLLGHKRSQHLARAISLGEEAGEVLPGRFREFVDFFDQVRPPVYANKLQQPTYQYYPELETKPWWNATEFPVAAALESAFPVIRAELQRAIEQPDQLLPYVGELPAEAPDDWQLLSGNPSWSSLHLLKGGERVEQNYQTCPQTTELLESLDLVKAQGHAPEAFFSILQPGTHIPPHYGLSNTKLVVHLAIDIPGQCAIRVGGEERTWEAGKCVVFDDSFAHEAWNRSDQTRVVLITEVWNPSLSELERAAIAAVIAFDDDLNAAAQEFSFRNLDIPNCD